MLIYVPGEMDTLTQISIKTIHNWLEAVGKMVLKDLGTPPPF